VSFNQFVHERAHEIAGLLHSALVLCFRCGDKRFRPLFELLNGGFGFVERVARVVRALRMVAIGETAKPYLSQTRETSKAS
jgi:hypothetical protein